MKSDHASKTTRQDPSDQRVVLVSASLRGVKPAAEPTAPPSVEVSPSAKSAGYGAVGKPAAPAKVSGPEVPAGGAAKTGPTGAVTAKKPPVELPLWLRRKESFWAETASWSVILFALMVGVSVLGWVYWTGDNRGGPSFFMRLLSHERVADQVVAPPPPAPEFRRAIDGLPAAVGSAVTDHYAVMIENMIDSRPLAGLSEASLVIEAPVEGGITRFLAFYPTGSAVSRIGPVRSARPYYLDWAREFDALYVHVGGSPEALEDIDSTGLRDLNQFSAGKYFWRDAGRQAPHNVYTSAELLGRAAADVFSDHQVRDPSAWKFKDDLALADRPQETGDIVIDYSTPSYRATWKYDRAANDYRRWQGEDEQRDESGAPVRAKNIVIQYSQIRILDEIGRRRIETLGEGQALVALDGRVFAAVWKKPAVEDRTRYFDESGAEIALNAGKTWVEIVQVGASVEH